MSVKTKEELLKAIQSRTEGQSDDETLAFIADVTDTLEALEAKASDSTDWKKKYEDNDAEWREKYKERFFSPKPETEESPDPGDDEPKEKTRYADLFTVKGN